MPKELKLILKEQPIGLEPTPKQVIQRGRFAQAAKEVARELKDSKLKGAAKIHAINRLMSQKLES